MIDSTLVLGDSIITLNDLTTDTRNYYKVFTQGWQAGTREIEEPLVEAHGVDDHDAYLNAINWEINGKIIAESRSKLYELKAALSAAYSPALRDYEDLKWTEPGQPAKQLSIRPLTVVYYPEERKQGRNLRFTIRLKAKDPFIYSQALNQESFDFDIGDQIGYPFNYSVYYGAGNAEATANCTNAGNDDAWTTVIINGPVTGPFMENTTTGERLEFSSGLVLAGGDTLAIDMKNKTVVKTSGSTNTNVYQYKTSTSDFWILKPGVNSVTLGGTTTSTDGGGTISWRNTYTS